MLKVNNIVVSEEADQDIEVGKAFYAAKGTETGEHFIGTSD